MVGLSDGSHSQSVSHAKQYRDDLTFPASATDSHHSTDGTGGFSSDTLVFSHDTDGKFSSIVILPFYCRWGEPPSLKNLVIHLHVLFRAAGHLPFEKEWGEVQEGAIYISYLFPWIALMRCPCYFRTIGGGHTQEHINSALGVGSCSSSASSAGLTSFASITTQHTSPLYYDLLDYHSDLLVGSLVTICVSSYLPLTAEAPLNMLVITSTAGPYNSLSEVVYKLVEYIYRFSDLTEQSTAY